MTTKSILAGAGSVLARGVALIGICLAANISPECRGVPTYSVAINTTALAGVSGILAFDLIGGDLLSANNTASIAGLSTDGSLTNSAGASITDVGFFNEELRAIVFGTYLNFTLQLSENHSPPGTDQFSFFLLDAASLLPLGQTTDPTTADALFAIDIDGSLGGTAQVFDSMEPNLSWSVTLQTVSGVPDEGNSALMLVAAMAAFAPFIWRRLRAKKGQ